MKKKQIFTNVPTENKFSTMQSPSVSNPDRLDLRPNQTLYGIYRALDKKHPVKGSTSVQKYLTISHQYPIPSMVPDEE